MQGYCKTASVSPQPYHWSDTKHAQTSDNKDHPKSEGSKTKSVHEVQNLLRLIRHDPFTSAPAFGTNGIRTDSQKSSQGCEIS